MGIEPTTRGLVAGTSSGITRSHRFRPCLHGCPIRVHPASQAHIEGESDLRVTRAACQG